MTKSDSFTFGNALDRFRYSSFGRAPHPKQPAAVQAEFRMAVQARAAAADRRVGPTGPPAVRRSACALALAVGPWAAWGFGRVVPWRHLYPLTWRLAPLVPPAATRLSFQGQTCLKTRGFAPRAHAGFGFT